MNDNNRIAKSFVPRRAGRLSLLGVLLLSLIACSGRSDLSEIEMPETSVLSLRAEWAVVARAYTRVQELPEPEAQISAHLRRGTVVEITDKSTFTDTMNDETSNWYRVRAGDIAGWVFGSALNLYNSEKQARNAADLLGDR